jgi:hypothetical protein
VSNASGAQELRTASLFCVILTTGANATGGTDLGQLRASEAGTGFLVTEAAIPMNELWLLRDAIAALILGAATSFPPIGTGAFWTIVAFYGVVSILFDDETPRGVPGIDYFYASRPHLKDPQS